MRSLPLADFTPALNHQSEVPLYRQLYERIALSIRSGNFSRGERLPATRELAGLLGLNRATVSAAYDMLETAGLIAGQVGRGSFVTGQVAPSPAGSLDWAALLEPNALPPSGPSGGFGGEISSFVMSRPARALFPLDDFRASCQAVLARPDLDAILQLGSPSGYEPLRRHLIDEARRQSLAAPGDDLLITNGCQQALDLIARVLLRLEEPAARQRRPARRHPGRPRWHGCHQSPDHARSLAPAFPGGHFEFPKPHRRHSATGLPPRLARCSPRRTRARRRKRRLWRAALLGRPSARHQATR